MNKISKAVFSLSLSFFLGSAAFAAESTSVSRADGHSVPVKLYGNWGVAGCPATVLLSPGLGGSEDGLAYFAEGLAEQGYRVAVMGHVESGRRALREMKRRGGAEAVLTDPQKYNARFMDIDAVLAMATKNCRPNPLILGGHSMGAATTMLEAGAMGKVPYGGGDRFDAYVALSPQGKGWMFGDGSWTRVKKPVLMITGTEDNGYDGSYTTRFAAFEGLPSGNKRIAVINGASHSDFGGRGNNAAAQAKTIELTATFLGQLSRGRLSPVVIDGVSIKDK